MAQKTNTKLQLLTSSTAIQTTEDLNNVFDLLKASLRLNKVGIKELKIHYREDTEKVVMQVRNILLTAPDEEVSLIWNRSKVNLRYDLIFEGSTAICYEMYERMVQVVKLEPDFLCRGFMSFHSKMPVQTTPYKNHFSDFSIDVVLDFYELVSSLTDDLAVQILGSMNKKVLFMFMLEEISLLEHHSLEEGVDEMVHTIMSKMPPPQDLEFSSFFCEMAPDVYFEVANELISGGHDEVRDVFYEVYNRTQNWYRSQEYSTPKSKKEGDSVDTDYQDALRQYLKRD